MLICIIASQNNFSNWKDYKGYLRPGYLLYSINSVLENTHKPDRIIISYNGEGYSDTINYFKENKSVIFIEQDKPCSQFEHINYALKYISDNINIIDSHILFMDDDDLLGSNVIELWEKWVITENVYVTYDRLSETVNSNCDKSQRMMCHKISDRLCRSFEGSLRLYAWYTNRLCFKGDYGHIVEITETNHCSSDFSGTIIPLYFVMEIFAHIDNLSIPTCDIVFMMSTIFMLQSISSEPFYQHDGKLYYRLSSCP